MRQHSEDICPNCHRPLIDGIPSGPANADTDADEPVKIPAEEIEYDHRGIALPRRTRMGGIITPQ